MKHCERSHRSAAPALAPGRRSRPPACVSLVVTHEGVAGLYVGTPREAWRAAATLSARRHIVYVDQPFTRVLSVMPDMYQDLWTAAKGMCKLEPAIADGGEVVIFAPHEDRCRRLNLGYLDPRSVDLAAWRGREHEGVIVIPRAGEMLYRVRRPAAAARRADTMSP